MRFGVVGLKSSVRDAFQVDNPKYSVVYRSEFAPNSPMDITKFAEGVDFVIVITKSTSSHALARIPKHKVFHVRGTVESLREFFKVFEQHHRNLAVPVISKSDTPPPAETTVVPSAPKLIDSSIRRGEWTSYAWKHGLDVIPTTATARLSYKILHNLPVGSVVRYAVPNMPDTAKGSWVSKIKIAVIQLMRNKQLFVNLYFFEEYVDFHVVKTPFASQSSTTEANLTEVREKFTRQYENLLTVMETGKFQLHGDEFDFWKQVYVAVISTSNSLCDAAKIADQAVIDIRERSK